MNESAEDPFAKVEETAAEKPAKKADPAKKKENAATEDAKSTDGIDFSQFLAEMTIGEEDFDAPAPFVPRYIRPAEGTWIPVRIVSARIEQREMRAVVATSSDGSLVTNPKAIDTLVEESGAEQSVETVTLWQFVVEAEHVATCFGERSSTYRLYTPVFPLRIPLNKPRTRNGVEELGFDKSSGKKLLAATRVVRPGMRLTEQDEETLQSIADAMVADGGKIVMARVRYRTKKSDDSIPRKNANGSFVKAKVDEVEGSFIRLRKDGDSFVDPNGNVLDRNEDGSHVYISSSGPADVFQESNLIPFGESFLIPDSSDDGVMVRDVIKREAVYDNLADDVYGVPGRNVTIQRQDDSEVEAEVTWETTGFITTQPVKAGTLIQAVAEGGELITASWLGTHWEEVAPHELSVEEDGKITMISSAKLAEGAMSKAGLDVFKGDAA